MAVVDVGSTTALRSAAVAGPPRRLTPVKWWAGLGAGFLTLALYVWTSWILSDDFTATPHGPTPIPDWVRYNVHAQEAIFSALAVWFLMRFLIRPWMRAGHITFDGLMIIASGLLWWQDPLGNFFQPIYVYNSVMFDMGSWASQIPGWVSPNGHMFIEPPLWALPAYLVYVFGAPMFLCGLMRRAQQRWPAMGPVGLLSLAFVAVATFDLLIEIGWIRLKTYAYPGGQGFLTLFSGGHFQLPWWELFFFPLALVGLTALRYFRDDKGRTVVERGIDDLRLSPRNRQRVRFLALVGGTQLVYLLCCLVPQALVGVYASAWPGEIQKNSYMTDMICGPGTDYACPGGIVPIQKEGKAHLRPDGKLVVPN